MRHIAFGCLLFTACATASQRPPGAHPQAEAQRPSPFRDFDRIAPVLGEEAPDFDLRTADGTAVRLAEVVRQGPVVLVFGSFS